MSLYSDIKAYHDIGLLKYYELRMSSICDVTQLTFSEFFNVYSDTFPQSNSLLIPYFIHNSLRKENISSDFKQVIINEYKLYKALDTKYGNKISNIFDICMSIFRHI